MDTGLSSDLLQQIRKILLSFEAFDGQRPLRSLFIDQRLTAWRDQLPQAENRQQRVTAVVGWLYGKTNRAGENGLVCLLAVLQKEVGVEDGRCPR